MDHIVVQLGVFFALSALVAVIFLYIKQSTILAFIAVGIMLGFFKSQIHLEQHAIDVISEIGIILLLFLAGMELDLASLKRKLRITMITGLGQIITFTIFGTILGLLLIKFDNLVGAIYFGLCLTFSSTIVVIKLLKDRKEIETFHGQTLIGILIMQDITAIFALVFLKSLGSDQSVIISVLLILAKMMGLGIVMFLFSRYLIKPLFKKFAKTSELLFIGSLGYVFGVAALCESIHFSPEIGAFLAGVTLANITYRIEIEDKVEPIKNLGVVLFFVTLGFNLDLSKDLLSDFPLIMLISLFVLLGTPVVVLFLGYLGKLKSRPSFFLGVMLNQISEFSLILATLCLGAGVFDNRTFTIITFASIVSVLLSSIGTSFLDKLYSKMKKRLKFIEKHSLRLEDQEEIAELELENHIVFLEYNAIVDMIGEKFADRKQPIIILDNDPDKIDYIEEEENKYYHAIYADPLDPDIWEELQLEKASLVFSGIEHNHMAEIALLQYLKNNKSSAVTIIHSGDYEEALEMYEHEVSLVIHTEHSAAERVINILEDVNYDLIKLAEHGVNHKKALILAKSKFMN